MKKLLLILLVCLGVSFSMHSQNTTGTDHKTANQSSQNKNQPDTTATSTSSLEAYIIDPGGGGGTLNTYYADNDMDGYGDPNSPHMATSLEIGYANNNMDCNDNCFTCHPGATEVQDGKDNDCDGLIDEGFGSTTPIAPSDESFESGLGDWTQETSDDMNWTRDSGGTPSTATGPATGQDGSYYLYLEASSNSNKTGIIKSALYSLPTNSFLQFSYHMYGAAMGSLSLEVSTNNGSSWSSLWTKSGDQGNQWNTTLLDLGTYGGDDVIFRFKGIIGSSYTSDMAIDNLVFSTSPGGGGGGCASVSLSNENYVYSKTYLTETATSISNPAPEEAMEEVTYFDGLGRPMQQVGIHQSGGTGYEDIITHIEYDAYGRQVKEYLPYPSQTCAPGTYRSSALSETNTYYDGAAYDADFPGMTTSSINPYSEKDLEASPLSRVQRQAAPGAAWKMGGGHEIEFDYETNVSSEVRLYEVTTSLSNGIYEPTLVLSGYYNPGELYKTVTYDENNNAKATAHSTEEFKDKQGNVVLKRTYKGTTKYDTYYVYDDYGNLTYVLPPKSEPQSAKPDATELSELCYQYKYDGRNRLAEKKLPGKGWEYIVYNKLDQPVMTQDQELKAKNQWLFTKYDAFGRVAYTGIKNSSNSRASFQNSADGTSYDQYEERTQNYNTFAGVWVYYNGNAIPTSMSEILTINYYDSYSNLNIGFSIPSSNTYGKTIVTGTATKGLATVTKVKVLGTSDWITTAMGYDDKGRVIWTKTTNPFLGTTEIVENFLDFSGNIKESKTTHQKTGKSDIVIVDTYTYDHMNRLKTHSQSINGGSAEMIADNSYDKLGQLTEKGVGNAASSSSRLQDITYSYNVRGWLKTINDVGNTNKLFNFKIAYNDPSSGTALYNGNISRVDWKTDNTDSGLKNYRYYYDDLNRLTSATANSTNYNVSNITYDKNGNILTLTRKGAINSAASSFGSMDVLAYGYNTSSNQLKTVNDSGNDTYGFKDGSSSTTQYTYDSNGNLTSDANKGITSITYNHLNLPELITIGGQTIDYTYDAAGTKLRKVIPGKTTDYAGNFIYEGGTLQFFSTPEGYVSYDNGQFNYVYNYVDHLGNVRLSYTDGDHNGSIDPATEIIQEKNYYPFGLEHKGYNSTIIGTENNYKTYNGKELEEELGKNTLAYGWRDYDPAIGRFNKVDRFSEKYYSLSTYSYAGNNPIMFVDVQGDSIASGASTRRANRIERRSERRADRLDRRADRREARGQDVADLRERSAELRQSGQDIRDMRADENNMYRFANVSSREAKNAGIVGPSTASTGTTESGLNEITLYTEGNMGSRLHETRHGGQHSRGEINAVTQSHGSLGLNAEVSAYRAQYSWSGKLNYLSHNVDQTSLLNRALLDSKSFNFALRNINNINQINLNMVRDIGEVFDASGLNLPGVNGTFWILPLYSN